MISLSLNELKLVAKSKGIKDHKNKFENKLIKTLSEPKLKTCISKTKIKKFSEKINELKDKVSKPEIKEIRRNIYNVKKQKNLSAQKIKEIEKDLFELENNLSKLKKYYGYDDTECKGIRDANNVLNFSIDEVYYKPIITNSAFNSNYAEYESKGDKDKILSIK